MKLYMFREEGSDRIALTADAAGAQLPQLGGVWRASGTHNLGQSMALAGGATAFEIVKAVEQEGYFMAPPLGQR